jgi:hypothetical protein
MLIGVRSGEAVINERGVAALGGPSAIAQVNAGVTGGGGDTFQFSIKSLTGQVDQASIDFIVKAIQQGKRSRAGALAGV